MFAHGRGWMKKHLKWSLALGLVLLLAMQSCTSARPAAPAAETTPRNTLIPWHTWTPTSPTSSPTALPPSATPLPPLRLTIIGCVHKVDCPDEAILVSYLAADVEENSINDMELDSRDNVRLFVGWCTKDETTLQASLEHITYIFKIDGISYLDRLGVEPGFLSTNDSADKLSCMFIGAMLGGWKAGESHRVEIGYSFDVEVFDGWNTRAPFTSTYIYDFRPILYPTETPTITPTPTATYLWLTATPACTVKSSITIQNNTGSQMTLHLYGPEPYLFFIQPGQDILKVCPGDYSYIASGCNNSVDTWVGKISSGDEETFICK